MKLTPEQRDQLEREIVNIILSDRCREPQQNAYETTGWIIWEVEKVLE